MQDEPRPLCAIFGEVLEAPQQLSFLSVVRQVEKLQPMLQLFFLRVERAVMGGE